MKKHIIEEINRMKLLSIYDNKITLTENVLNEAGAINPELVKAAEEGLKVGSSEMKSVLNQIGKDANSMARLKTVGIDSVEGLLPAIKSGGAEGSTALAEFIKGVLKDPKLANEELRGAAVKQLSDSPAFAQQFKVELSQADHGFSLKKSLKQKGYSEKSIESILDTKFGKSNGKTGFYDAASGKFRGEKFSKDVKNSHLWETGIREKTAIDGTKIKMDPAGAVPSSSVISKLKELKDSAKGKIILGWTRAKGWNWKNIIKNAALIGVTAAACWWLFHGSDDEVPTDIPPTPPKEDGTYTTPGDPYQYKVVDCVWFTKSLENRGKIIKDWTSLANNKKATNILDGRHPDARKGCGGSTPTPPVVTSGNTSGNTVTTSASTINQQYGVEPQPNAQAEVQTTNDDINNY